MSALDDPVYLRLYRDYAKAIQQFENATADRKRVRDQLAVRRTPVMRALQQAGRRPVGAPAGHRIPPGRPAPPRPAAAKARQIYMGDILGWAQIVPTPGAPAALESEPGIDSDKLYDETSRRLYWNAKAHYQKCKRAFFDHVRKQNIDLHRERAAEELQQGATQQLLGIDESDDPEFMKEARKHVDAACRNVWALYQGGGPKKSADLKVLLVESIADAQFVGLDSATVLQMTAEMNRLAKAGELSITK